MGQLRTEPKKQAMEEEAYQGLAAMLREGRKLANEQHIFYDLDPGENPSVARKDLLYVARKEKIGLHVNRKRGARALTLKFQDIAPDERKPRLVIADAKRAVLQVLRAADTPKTRIQLQDLIHFEMTPSQWGGVLRALITDNTIIKNGSMRNTKYSIPKGDGDNQLKTRLVKKQPNTA